MGLLLRRRKENHKGHEVLQGHKGSLAAETLRAQSRSHQYSLFRIPTACCPLPISYCPAAGFVALEYFESFVVLRAAKAYGTPERSTSTAVGRTTLAPALPSRRGEPIFCRAAAGAEAVSRFGTARSHVMSKSKQVNVALIGQAFMGRAHSNAWAQVARFFDPPVAPVMHTICARNEQTLASFAGQWGWSNWTTDWKGLLRNDEIDLVDIATPNHLHLPMAAAALKAGKAVACEKPLAGTLKDARQMAELARKTRARTFVWYNYRRCPAVATAHQLVRRGRIGKIRHVRALYLQDWADESVPLTWRFEKKTAGSGALGDLAAHIVDMTRFVMSQEITEVSGAISETFIKKRRRMAGSAAGGIASGLRTARGAGKVSVDDAVLFLARFAGGAVASFEAARQATGNQNRNGFEINGTKGSIRFNFERMNELEYYDATADRAVQGWTTIICTHAGDHAYVDAWWPDAHLIGYEHGFVNQAYDILRMLGGRKPVVPMPDFEDAYQTQRVLEAATLSARQKESIKLSQVR